MFFSLPFFAAAAAAVAVSAPQSPSSTRLQARQSVAEMPTEFSWTSTGPLVGPKDDGRGIAGIKDPSVVYHEGQYHVFASTAQDSGYNLVYFSFTDYDSAGSATFHYLDQSGIGTGYRAAPQVFFFEPHQLWYLIYQNGNAAYSTNADISNPAGWTAPTNFYSGMPQIISDNIGDGYWVDMWVICDDDNCHLFSSDDNGHLYRSQTSLCSFPSGMSDPVIALEDANPHRLFEAACVYTLPAGDYLLLVEAIGSDGARWIRSWTADAIAGPYVELAAEESTPFARANNVDFVSADVNGWTTDISHGELVRYQVDQTLPVSPCELVWMYQGRDPAYSGSYNGIPWRIAVATYDGPIPDSCGDPPQVSPTASPTASPTPSPTDGPGDCQAQMWDQCGGNGFTGCTNCVGSTCTFQNEWYSQCL